MAGIEPQPAPAPEAHASESEGPILLPELLRPTQAGRIQWSQALPCAALGGAFSLLLVIPLSVLGAGSPLGPLVVFGVAFLAGGAWAARLYTRKVKNAGLSPGAGAQVGAASGGFGFLFLAVIVVAMAVYRSDEMRQLMADSAPQLISRGYDPEKLQQMLAVLRTADGLVVFVAFGLLALLVMFVVGSSIGGAWYGAWTRKRIR